MGPCNCEGEAQRAGRYLLLVVVVGMAVCLAGMLRRLRGLRELGGRAEGGGTRNTGLKGCGGLWRAGAEVPVDNQIYSKHWTKLVLCA